VIELAEDGDADAGAWRRATVEVAEEGYGGGYAGQLAMTGPDAGVTGSAPNPAPALALRFRSGKLAIRRAEGVPAAMEDALRRALADRAVGPEEEIEGPYVPDPVRVAVAQDEEDEAPLVWEVRVGNTSFLPDAERGRGWSQPIGSIRVPPGTTRVHLDHAAPDLDLDLDVDLRVSDALSELYREGYVIVRGSAALTAVVERVLRDPAALERERAERPILDDAELRRVLGQARRDPEAGRLDEAVRLYGVAVRTLERRTESTWSDRELRTQRDEVRREAAAVHLERAGARLAVDDWTGALGDHERARALDPALAADGELRAELARRYAQRARNLARELSRERPAAWGMVLVDSDRALELASDDAEVLAERGDVHLLRGEHDAALRDLEAAIRGHGDDLSKYEARRLDRAVGRALLGRAAAARADGDAARAEADVDAALRRDARRRATIEDWEQHQAARRIRAWAREEQGDRRGAIEDLVALASGGDGPALSRIVALAEELGPGPGRGRPGPRLGPELPPRRRGLRRPPPLRAAPGRRGPRGQLAEAEPRTLAYYDERLAESLDDVPAELEADAKALLERVRALRGG